jgi:radical SAM superfamily enzyme YgiQ (UPF0313 family)
MIERNVPVKLLMETRVDDILRDEDIMDKYRQAGVEHIYVGVEAGTQVVVGGIERMAPGAPLSPNVLER